RLIDELKARSENELLDLSDRMTIAGRMLDRNETGQPTLERQTEILKILDRLIEEAEKKEKSCSGEGPAGGSNPSGGPANRATLPEGKVAPPNLSTSRRNFGAHWTRLQESERKEILQLLRENFPERYKHLIEQYFKDTSGSDR
ncbi:MAG: hypothetical protein QF645_13465, partial [Planctomycetota bacterium]|nr:hypothetical protein [Planctomycetota bacterium]